MLLDDNSHANAGVKQLQGGAPEAAGPATGSNRNSADWGGAAGAKSSGDGQAHILKNKCP